jgi:hypothetical protein
MGKRGPEPIPPEVRFWSHVERGSNDECWPWGGGRSTGGYGRFFDGGKGVQAHRFAYEMLVGPIPDGLDLDHLCRVRHCVNPSHLEPVTRSENLRRGDMHKPIDGGARAVWQRGKTHCPKGHPYDEENTLMHYWKRENSWRRLCRTCHRQGTRVRRGKPPGE